MGKAAWALAAAPLAVLALAALTAGAQAATLVPAGDLPGDATWTASQGPYTLEGTVRVPAGARLLIDAGVSVLGAFGGHLVVEGTLDVRGTQALPVTFAPGPAEGSWGGIKVNATGAATLAYATITRAETGVWMNGTGTVTVTQTLIERSLSQAVAVTASTSGVLLQDVTATLSFSALFVADGDARILAERFTVVQMVECVFVTNASNITLRAASIRVCGGAAVNLTLARDVTVENSSLREFSTAGVVALSSDRLRLWDNDINGTLPIDNKAGVRLIGCGGCVVEGNRVTANETNASLIFLNPPVGIHDLDPVAPNTVARNAVVNYHLGILVENAIYPQRLEANVVGAGPSTGIELHDSPNQTLLDNQITGRNFSFAVNVTSPLTPWYYRQYLTNNTVDGLALLSLMDRNGASVDLTGVAVLHVVDSQSISLTNGSLRHGAPSVLLAGSSDVELRDSHVQSNETGVAVVGSTAVRVANVTIEGGITCLRFEDGRGNRAANVSASVCIQALLTRGREADFAAEGLTVQGSGALVVFGGTNITVRDSVVSATFGTGASNGQLRYGRSGPAVVELGEPRGVLFDNVTFEAVEVGVEFRGMADATLHNVTVRQATSGLMLANVSRLMVNGSALSGSTFGIRADDLRDSRVEETEFGASGFRGFLCIGCSNVTVERNLFVGSAVALSLSGGGNCTVTRNIFFFNTLHATTDTGAHRWDDGAVGNLWDDYTGLDQDDNGIGDTPYPIGFGLDSDFFPIAIYQDPVGPNADAGPDIVAYEDMPVLLSGYLSSDDVGIRAYLWSFVDRGANVTVPGLSTRYWFQTPGVYFVTLTVIDWGGNRDSDTLTVTILDRTAPRADAGGNRTVDEDTPFVLDATRTLDNDPRFPNGAIFIWYIADLNGSFALSGMQATWMFSTPGNYTVVLYVEDASGYSDTDQAFVVVRDVTPPVVPPLEAPAATEDSPFRVYGSAPSDNDPQWPKGMRTWFELWKDGARVALTNASPAIFNVSQPGPYTVVFHVSDAAGNTGSASLTFEVADVTPPDLSLIGDRQGEVGEPMAFDVSLATDNDLRFPEGAQAAWMVTLAGGRVGLAGTAVEYTFPSVGDFSVVLQLRDRAGNLAETSFLAHVRDTRPPLVTVTGPATVEAGDLAVFTANATDASLLGECVWTGTPLSAPRFGCVLNLRLFTPGLAQLTVYVEDGLGHGTNASVTVDVVDTTSPTMRVDFDPPPKGGVVNVTLGTPLQAAFLGADASASLLVEWAWGDGSNSTGTAASHLFAAEGNYSVRVRAADPWGNANSTTYLVRVRAPPPIDTPVDDGENLPTETTFPALAVGVLVAGGTIAGVLVGFRVGRGRRTPWERHP